MCLCEWCEVVCVCVRVCVCMLLKRVGREFCHSIVLGRNRFVMKPNIQLGFCRFFEFAFGEQPTTFFRCSFLWPEH